MKTPDQGIRKAAILVASLDRATADAMLEGLGPEQARRVRQTMVALGEIDPREQRVVIEEFFRTGFRPAGNASPCPADGGPQKNSPGVEFDVRLPDSAATPREPLSHGPSHASPPTGARPFRFLREAEVEKLTRVLRDERPQTIALVLSHLPPEQAGGVLVRLRPAVQVDVVHRLVDLEETDPEILREVEQALQARLSQQVHMQRRRVAGLKAVTCILEASGGQVTDRILDNLAACDQPLAERLSLPAPKFDDLARLDDAALAVLFRAAEPELVMTALVGAPPKLIDRILGRFAAPEARCVRHKLDHPGPIRLRDVDGAREQIADLARRLAREGRIELSEEISLAAA